MNAKSFLAAMSAVFFFIQTQNVTQGRATVREVNREMPTYHFSDPDPVPNIGRIYPYFLFEGYAFESENQSWKFVELENDYIKVFITPEIGGKIWGAVEKSTGKEFIYFNHAVKFRHVAMRGPWTSGGIESNFGVIGHAPTCSTPVDYLTKENDDGSVSCIIGALDLPSRTEWRVEINLQPDKSYFTTKALWYNPTHLEQAYYHWMNAGVKSAGNLEFSYPGTNYIGHDGSLHSWPTHPEGMDLSWYEKNNFGRSKSYHVLGEVTGFFGGYWHDDAFGFGHYSDYQDKPGKKLWIWGLSRQGMIWEDLLTDTDGQYVEIQSGRLFNQEASGSIRTPFKHRSFAPGSADQWTEYWFPIMSTGGVVQASPKASVNLEEEGGSLNVWLSSNEVIKDPLLLEAENGQSVSFQIDMAPATVWHNTISWKDSKDRVAVKLGSEYIIPPGGREGQRLSRPKELIDFDWSTVQGMAIEAKSLVQERSFEEGMRIYLDCLEKDPHYIPALVGIAGLYARQTNLKKGLEFVRKALSVDTYHPAGNFLYGSMHEELGHDADALDGYAIASASVEYRSAATLGLARIHFKRGEQEKALDYAATSIDYNPINMPAHELQLLAYRKMNDQEAFQSQLSVLLEADPLNHFARFEKYLITRNAQDLSLFKDSIQNELPHETYLELALKYYNLGLLPEAALVLDFAPEESMVLYWKAYLESLQESEKATQLLARANDRDPLLVFPFRSETIPVLEWAASSSNSWKPTYYLGLIWWNLGLVDKAQKLFEDLGNRPDFAPFYRAKSVLFEKDGRAVSSSLKKAIDLAPDDWRANLSYSRHLLENGHASEALQIAEKSFKRAPANYYLGLHYAKTLLLSDESRKCLGLLEDLEVLPNEGATEGYHLYRLSNLNLARDAHINRDSKTVSIHLKKAQKWPENLGVGKPYISDERIEDYLRGLSFMRTGNRTEARRLFEGIVNYEPEEMTAGLSAGDVLVLASQMKLNHKSAAKKLQRSWVESYPSASSTDWLNLWMGGKMKALSSELDKWKQDNPNPKIGSEAYYLFWVFDLLVHTSKD